MKAQHIYLLFAKYFSDTCLTACIWSQHSLALLNLPCSSQIIPSIPTLIHQPISYHYTPNRFMSLKLEHIITQPLYLLYNGTTHARIRSTVTIILRKHLFSNLTNHYCFLAGDSSLCRTHNGNVWIGAAIAV